MGFKQIIEEKREVMFYLYNEKKSQRFIAEETGISRKDAQGGLKRWRGLNVSLNLEEKRKSSKISDRTLVKISLADRKLTSKKLTTELKYSTGAKLSAPGVRKGCWEMVFLGEAKQEKAIVDRKTEETSIKWAPSHDKWSVEK